MNTHKEFLEFLKLLNKNDVEFVIVGGYAVAFYGYVRVTKDLDILFHNKPDTIEKLKKALKEFGFPAKSLEGVAFSEQGKIIRIGVAPVMIELINAISGLTFEQLWKNRVSGLYGTVKVYYISKTDLLKNKTVSGRPQDIADIEELKSID